MRFMLDTDIVSYMFRGESSVVAKVLEHRASELCLSVMTLTELRFGATLRKSSRLHQSIDGLTRYIAVMPFDDECATQFARIATNLAERGTPIGDFDALIAAHAITLDVTLITNNVKHFSRVRGLKLENWL